ncbi:MAG: outer membrane protein assembly factor BamD [Magnetococcus sp. DMHC-6]
MIRRPFFVLLLITLFATGCSTTEEAIQPDIPAETLYLTGMEALKDGRHKTASKNFEEVDRKHPFSPWATKAQINLIYSHYKEQEFPEVISSAERFIRLHPRHPHVSYAYYMRGLAHYQQISTALKDQLQTREAMVAFQEVISRFPQSDYAWEAERMLNLCRFRLAEQEIVVARYYLDRAEYIAAMNRFAKIIENPQYNDTPFVEEALFSLSLASIKLGLQEEAKNYAAVLGHNFPQGPYYQWTYGMLEGNRLISKSELQNLRREVASGSLFTQFFEGLKPGMPSGMTTPDKP